MGSSEDFITPAAKLEIDKSHQAAHEKQQCRKGIDDRGETKLRDLVTYTRELMTNFPWFKDEMVGLAFYH